MTTASFDPASGVLTVTGGSAADSITISRDAAGVILVNGGAIVVTGGTPTVANTALIEVSGLVGNDTVALDESNGALPRATLVAGSGHDTEAGGSGSDTLLGDSGNDILLGKGGFDLLFGGDGNDTLTGGDADDQLFGEGGNDRMIWNPGDDTDLFEGGLGTDTAEVNGGNGAEVFVITANGTRVRFDRVDPAPFALDIGTTENLVVHANGGDDSVTASGNLAALIGLTIDGGAGNDTLAGGNGADLLIGGDGNDVVTGVQGNDHALLGAGDDRFVWNPGDGSDAVEGEDGVDALDFNASNGNENIAISADGRRTLITRDIGAITMDLLDVETINIDALGGNDTIAVGVLSATPVAQVVIELAASGGTAADGLADQVTIDGTTRNDTISVAGSGGTLSVAGLSALVTIAHSEAIDGLTIRAGAGSDTVTAAALPGGNTSLLLDGGTGNDTLIGSAGADILLGGDGNDLISGRQGTDVALMGAGNDVFTWSPGDSSDTVEGQDGTDTLDFFASAANENIDIAANGGRVRLFRDIANITMDMNDVERITQHALGGVDTTVINDLSGTDITQLTIDLAGTIGGTAGDGQIDTVIANVTAGDDAVSLRGSNGTAIVEGLAYSITVAHAEAADRIIVNGLGGADTLNAASLAASAMALILDGGAGDDTLTGGGGADQLFGGDDNDVLVGGGGSDQLFGLAGTDRMIWNPGDGTDLMEGGDGADTAEVNGGDGAESFTITANGTRVRFDRVDAAPFSLDIGTTERLVLDAGGGGDLISAAGNLAALISLTIDGGAGDDTILAGNGADVILGGDGNDFIDGQQGNDVALLGAGNDVFHWDPGDGSDIVEGQDGTDTLDFFASAANENIDIAANGGRVRLFRDIGNIIMDMNDIERIAVHALGGTDSTVINDLSGTDVTQVAIDLAGTIGGSAGDGLADTVIANGSAGDDTVDLHGNNGTAVAEGLAASITVSHAEAIDRLVVNGLGGADTLDAASLTASAIALTLDGGADNDTLTGGGGGDLLLGGDGDDIVTGKRGNDLAFLGAGNDRFAWSVGDGVDTVEGQAGADQLDLGGSAPAQAFGLFANGGRVVVQDDNAGAILDIDDIETVALTLLGGPDTVTVDDLAGTDVTRVAIDLAATPGGALGDGQVDRITINGTVGDDVVELGAEGGGVIALGLAAAVAITHAEAGDQILVNGDSGVDFLSATAPAANGGQFIFDGGTGNDIIIGGAGNDVIIGAAGADNLDGGTGIDTLDYRQSADAVTIDIRLNTATGGDAISDTIARFENVLGSDLADTITGSAGVNLLDGGQGNDALSALGGNDTLDGDIGNDLLTGGAGLDTLIGGTGADLFIYVAAADSAVSAQDLITDFHRSHHDKIDVTAIDANTVLAGDQSFSFINTAAFGGNRGELRIAYGTDSATVSGDINGDGTADFAITLAGIDAAHALAVSDFLL
ncbi:hypothetical protein D3874_15050 [Oleomonas cavernae]|uniref:Calcium-binding protein n=1 Tax=Oleomonas cavernae TaxID=2320859 RepID=A0A418WDZ2_9PROT|nr:calcium-binding protein [Oleomonas cavernae]RJF88169.1 hypothetical protein D3874_15050 [Oleomonas cavernae]